MRYMFRMCENLENVDLSSFNTAKVTNMVGMFEGATLLKKVYVSTKWTTKAVKYDDYMLLTLRTNNKEYLIKIKGIFHEIHSD